MYMRYIIKRIKKVSGQSDRYYTRLTAPANFWNDTLATLKNGSLRRLRIVGQRWGSKTELSLFTYF